MDPIGAARKLTKCQWSAMPQEVIDCGPQGQRESSVSVYFLPHTIVSTSNSLSTISSFYVSLSSDASCCCKVFSTSICPLLAVLYCLNCLILNAVRLGTDSIKKKNRTTAFIFQRVTLTISVLLLIYVLLLPDTHELLPSSQ